MSYNTRNSFNAESANGTSIGPGEYATLREGNCIDLFDAGGGSLGVSVVTPTSNAAFNAYLSAIGATADGLLACGPSGLRALPDHTTSTLSLIDSSAVSPSTPVSTFTIIPSKVTTGILTNNSNRVMSDAQHYSGFETVTTLAANQTAITYMERLTSGGTWAGLIGGLRDVYMSHNIASGAIASSFAPQGYEVAPQLPPSATRNYGIRCLYNTSGTTPNSFTVESATCLVHATTR